MCFFFKGTSEISSHVLNVFANCLLNKIIFRSAAFWCLPRSLSMASRSVYNSFPTSKLFLEKGSKSSTFTAPNLRLLSVWRIGLTTYQTPWTGMWRGVWRWLEKSGVFFSFRFPVVKQKRQGDVVETYGSCIDFIDLAFCVCVKIHSKISSIEAGLFSTDIPKPCEVPWLCIPRCFGQLQAVRNAKCRRSSVSLTLKSFKRQARRTAELTQDCSTIHW